MFFLVDWMWDVRAFMIAPSLGPEKCERWCGHGETCVKNRLEGKIKAMVRYRLYLRCHYLSKSIYKF